MSSSTHIQALLLISGHVQGVFFRAHAQEQAKKLELTGYARNLSDGRVEILLQGTEEKIQTLLGWIESLKVQKKIHPSSLKAKVEALAITWSEPAQEYENFQIL